MDTVELKPETQQLVLKIDTYESDIVIKNNIDYERIAEELKQIKLLYNNLDNERKAATKPIDEAKKKIMDWFRIPLERLITAEGRRKTAILNYQREQERIRFEAEEKLRKEAEKKRQEALKKAEEAREQGKEAKAEKYEDKANNIIAPTLAPTVQNVTGISTRMVWKFEVIDEKFIPREYLMPDLVKIGKIVRAIGGTLLIPGIRIFPEETITAGGR